MAVDNVKVDKDGYHSCLANTVIQCAPMEGGGGGLSVWVQNAEHQHAATTGRKATNLN